MALLIPLVKVIHIKEIDGCGVKRLHVLLVHISLGPNIGHDHTIAKIPIGRQDRRIVFVVAEVPCVGGVLIFVVGGVGQASIKERKCTGVVCCHISIDVRALIALILRFFVVQLDIEFISRRP